MAMTMREQLGYPPAGLSKKATKKWTKERKRALKAQHKAAKKAAKEERKAAKSSNQKDAAFVKALENLYEAVDGFTTDTEDLFTSHLANSPLAKYWRTFDKLCAKVDDLRDLAPELKKKKG